MAPPRCCALPLVILATAATVIASQAVITGAFSLTQQAIQLGLLPRHGRSAAPPRPRPARSTCRRSTLCWLIGVVLLMVVFQTSDNLAHAYGLAVTGTMVVTTSLAFIVVRRDVEVGPWSAPLALIGPLVRHGPDLPGRQRAEDPLRRLGAAADRRGAVFWSCAPGCAARELLADKTRRDSVPLSDLAEMLEAAPPHRVAGTADLPDLRPRRRAGAR